MIKTIFYSILTSLILMSCVSASKYDQAVAQKDALQKTKDSLNMIVNTYGRRNMSMAQEINDLKAELDRLQKNYDRLKESSSAETLEMIEKLEALQIEIANKEKRIAEIKRKLEAREKTVQNLKKTVNDALLGFKAAGLSVSVKNGKVYVSLSNKLLFKVGKTDIDKQGQDALLELAKVLKNEQDINVLVEGHTDDQKVRGTGRFKDNWDLSVLRATEVVRFLQLEGGVDPTRIVASGRSEYIPVDEADTDEARAMNRRTEIILTPKLEELYQIIE